MRRLDGHTWHIRRELREMGAVYRRGSWYVPTGRYDEAVGWLEIGKARYNAGKARPHGAVRENG